MKDPKLLTEEFRRILTELKYNLKEIFDDFDAKCTELIKNLRC